MVHAIGVTVSRPLTPVDRVVIREIFLRRRSEYTAREAARLLRLSLGEFFTWTETGLLDVQQRRKRRQLGGRRHQLVTWNELASAAMLRWTVIQIHDALGEDANRVLPRLLQPAELKAVRLPEYQVRLLETFAQREGISVEEYVFNALLDLEAAADPDDIEKLLPGFHEAMTFPEL